MVVVLVGAHPHDRARRRAGRPLRGVSTLSNDPALGTAMAERLAALVSA